LSVEVEMTAPLSGDLRRRLIRAVDAGSSAREAARRFEVSASAAIKLVRRVRETGSAEPAKIGGYRRPLLSGHEDLLREMTEGRPGITLVEIQAELTRRGVEASSLTTIWSTLRRLGLRHKKMSLTAAEQDRPDVAAERRQWRVWQRYMDPERFVFLDETGASTNMVRRYGWRPHGERLVDLPDLYSFYSAFPQHPLVSVSDHQRRPLPPVNWVGTVHHGLPTGLLPFTARPQGGYLAFLGRISPEKRPDRAIEIALRAGMKLRIAAKIDQADQRYFDQCIASLLAANPHVELVGEIDEQQKPHFLGQAAALLFPIDWPEPFGLVMIEAMACGTPVIAFDNGSVPEVVQHGVTGFIVSDVVAAAAAVDAAMRLDRARIRKSFDHRFAARRMAEDYLAIYRRLPGVRRAAGREAAGRRAGVGPGAAGRAGNAD